MGLFVWPKRRTRPTPTPAVAIDNTSPLGESVERRAVELGAQLLDAARSNQSGLFSKAFWSDKLMEFSMRDADFKTQLFRFVDVLPALKTPELIHEHLVDYLKKPGLKLPPGLSIGMSAGGMAQGLFARTVTGQIEGMARKFIAGTDAADALPTLAKLWKRNIAFSVDLLGEACVSEAESREYQRRYLDLLSVLPASVRNWKPSELLERDHLGVVPRVNVSVKISALSPKTDPIDFEGSLARSIESIAPIVEAAQRAGALVNFDMEHHGLKDFSIELFMRCCERFPFEAGIAMQAYLKSAEADVGRIIDWSKRTGRVVTVRLVKGAYWDFETIHARQQGWPCPVWETKPQTDACFERVTKQLVDAMPTRAGEGGPKLALGSHNLRSIAVALALLEQRGLPTSAIELQMLHGMADELKTTCVERGLRVREYIPVGAMLPGMAYLVRRLLENTSNESWLRAGFSEDVPTDKLLGSPHHEVHARSLIPVERDEHKAFCKEHGIKLDFTNEPLRDFSDAKQRDAFAKAIGDAVVPAVRNDSTVEQAREAIGRAEAYAAAWRDTDFRWRSAVIMRAASLMQRRRDELAGVIIRENGKTWRNADADVCEAIDFCLFYAPESIRLFMPWPLGEFVGEQNDYFHQPRGVCVVISPWNFPLAIACGMTVAALVTGNTVVLKPAEQTPGIAKLLVDILYEAGVPREALHFLPGPGETVGAALVRDPRVSLIAFTGSKAVGFDILRAAAPTDESLHVKRVVCEMGGKNAIIVDASADLDEAVLGVRDSAFGFSGQKCSACSRVIVHAACYDDFVRRLVESTKSLVVGDPLKPGTDMGPLIDDEAAAKVRRYVDLARRDGKLEIAVDQGGRFVGPHIVTGLSPDHPVARDEIFGPLLCVLKASDFDHALRLANDSPYKLTGGVFSRTPTNLDRARREFRVGNLYLNRGITGALVGRQPFGGFGLSGVGSKAGGQDYLLQFVEPRVVTENTMRRGFAPTAKADQREGEAPAEPMRMRD
jgi:RHH-type proline utilization regulon transcriptional repressor/proline dehydrogenase/delta 1-pyrroline-5-carboxylate dehydrogenase